MLTKNVIVTTSVKTSDELIEVAKSCFKFRVRFLLQKQKDNKRIII